MQEERSEQFQTVGRPDTLTVSWRTVDGLFEPSISCEGIREPGQPRLDERVFGLIVECLEEGGQKSSNCPCSRV